MIRKPTAAECAKIVQNHCGKPPDRARGYDISYQPLPQPSSKPKTKCTIFRTRPLREPPKHAYRRSDNCPAQPTCTKYHTKSPRQQPKPAYRPSRTDLPERSMARRTSTSIASTQYAAASSPSVRQDNSVQARMTQSHSSS